jgi:hypothetical protein
MSSASNASAGPPTLTAIQRDKRRRVVFAIVAASFFLWPIALQHEFRTIRLDTVRLGEAGGAAGRAAGGRVHAGAHRGYAPRQIVTAAVTPGLQGLALLSPLPPSLLGSLERLPPIAAAVSADLPEFATPAAAISSFTSPSIPGGPAPGFVSTPGGTNPPSPPPVIGQPPVDPPVTLPVTPPDPSSPPPVILPPVTFPPPIDPAGPGPIPPIITDPGGPGGGGPGGGPVAGIPEPGIWLELVLGAGLAGASLRSVRRDRGQPATALRARSRA